MKKNILLATLSIFLSAQIFASIALASSGGDRVVSVGGSCTRESTTDRGSVTVTANVLESDIKTAVKKATAQYDRCLEAVKKLGLENFSVQSTEYSVSEEKDWVKDHYVSKGFRARIGFKVSTSNIQRLGEVTEIAAREDIHEVGNLTTYLSKDKLKKEQESCLKEAAEDARSKADKLATSLGASLGRVLLMSENNDGGPPPFHPLMMRGKMMMAEASGAAEPAAPTIQEGRQDVSAHVQVSFELK